MIVCCRLPPGQGDVPTVPWCGLHSPIHEGSLQTPLYSYRQHIPPLIHGVRYTYYSQFYYFST